MQLSTFSASGFSASAKDRFHLASLLAIVVLSVLVRACYIDQPLHYDEAFTFTYYASKPLRIALADYSAPNNHLFHTFLVHGVYRLLGNQPWVIRLPAFLAGVLLIPAAYIAAHTFYNKHVALLTAALVASAGPLIAFSTNARGYMIVCLVFIILITIAKQIKERANFGLWALFVVLSVLGFYTIPVMLYAFGAIVFWLVLSAVAGDTVTPFRRLLRDLSIACVAVGVFTFLLYLPVIMRSGLKSITGNRWVTSASGSLGDEVVSLASGIWYEWSAGFHPLIVGAIIAGLVIAALAYWQERKDIVPLILATTAWSLVLLLLTRRAPFVRVMLFMLPLVIAVAAAGIHVLLERLIKRDAWRERIVPVLALVLAITSMAYVVFTDLLFNPYLGDNATLRDAPAIATFLADHLSEGDKILTAIPADAPLEYYLYAKGVPHSYLAWEAWRPDPKANLSPGARLLIVVDADTRQSLADVLRENDVPLAAYAPATLLQSFPHGSALYEMRKVAVESALAQCAAVPVSHDNRTGEELDGHICDRVRSDRHILRDD